MCARRSGGPSKRRKFRAPGRQAHEEKPGHRGGQAHEEKLGQRGGQAHEEKLGHRGGGGETQRERGGGRQARFHLEGVGKEGKGCFVMLAAWRAVCLAALLAALAATLATGADAGAGDTVRDFGLVCNVFRNVLQARGVAKAKKVRAHEVALAIEHAWLGEASGHYEVAVKYSPHNAKPKANEAQRLKKQAEELADKIDALSYSAILGNISNGQPDKAENETNVVFGAMAGSGDNKGFADAQSGAALSSDMMWLCNLAGADATDKKAPFKQG
ncbi:hypothetical protein, conserved in T. vivax, partial [Trypanosoma vivax Y486]